ncbi:MAG TPA: hypothetical protein VFK05_17340, partial [Polyangiaceae bacterium]|nr:hypothetical protein [Polyangiaceae bacterium]
SACNAAATDTGMNQEMARHDDAMQSLMGMMGMRFDQMGHCYHGDAATMKGLMSEVLGAEQTHREHMTDAKSLDDAQAECQRYVTEAGADIDQMRQRYQHEGAQCMMMMM